MMRFALIQCNVALLDEKPEVLDATTATSCWSDGARGGADSP